VNTDGQIFFDRSSTSAAFLAGACRVHFDNLDPGAFSLGHEDANEVAPCNIADRASQPVVPDHSSNAQVFHRDDSMIAHESKRNFVVMISSLFTNTSVDTLKLYDSFSAVLSTTLFPADSPGSFAQNRKRRFQESGIRDVDTGIRGEKRFQSDINPSRGIGAWFNRSVAEIAREDSKPLPSLFFYRYRFDNALDLAMLVYSNFPDVLNTKLAINELDAVSVRWKFDRTESPASFESWVTWFFSGFYTTKETLERFIEPPHRCLSAGEIQSFKIRINVSFILIPRGLFRIFDRTFFLLPGFFSLAEAGIVQAAMRLQHNAKLTGLVSVDVESEFVGAAHCLLPPLVFNISTNRCFTDMTHGTCVVTPAPQCWKPRTQRSKFSSQLTGCSSFETIYDFSNTQPRISLDKQMNVIRHNLKGMNHHLELFGNFSEQLDKPCFNISNQYASSIFWTPDEVVFERVDCSCVFAVPFHGLEVYLRRLVSQGKGGRAFLCRLKATVPCPRADGSTPSGMSTTNSYAVWAQNSAPVGTLTNAYGVYLGSQRGQTLSYGIYQNDSDDSNYFAGDVSVGATTPDGDENFYVEGKVAINAGVTGINTALRCYPARTIVDIDLVCRGVRVETGDTVTTGYGIWIDEPTWDGGGTINNIYGLRIDAQKKNAAASATAYGIYQSGTDDINHFNGTIRLKNCTTTVMNAISPTQAGMLVFNTTANKVYVYDGTSWVALH